MALTLKSQRQIQTDILNTIISRLGLTDVNPGSVLDLLTQAVSQEDFNQYVQMSQIVRLVDLDSTTGEDLENRAFEYGLTRTDALTATGTVTITRTGYTKVSTSFVSAGVLAPSQGDITLVVNSTDDFISGGTNMVVVGRGLGNEEVKTIPSGGLGEDDNGNPTITISSPLAFNHSFTEDVTFIPQGQTDIIINAGETVTVPATGTNVAVNFDIIVDQTLFAGEDTLENIDVRAQEPGGLGNVGTSTINIISVEGLTVTNESSFTTGTDLETDAGLRDRIRSHIQSLSRGTQQSIQNAVVGLVDTSTSKRVVSANIVLPQSTDASVKVFIDDGTGFEPSFDPQASEALVSDASRGTSRLQLDFAPIVKAQIESANDEPFVLTEVANADVDDGLSLTVRIGGLAGVEETINVLASDLEFPSTTRAEEIVKIINNKASIFEARTSETGSKIVVSAVTDTNEDIFVSRPSTIAEEFDLNTYVQFTNAEQSTSYIYKNDKLLFKDGITASLTTSSDDTTFDMGSERRILIIEVDGKTVNPQVITFDPAINDDLTNSTTPAILAGIINEQATGLAATTIENGGRLQISSATTLSSDSKIRVKTPTAAELTAANASDANVVLGISTTEVEGSNNDYTLNRELGTIELSESLEDGDTITAGNAFNRATIRTPSAVTSSTRINEGVGFTLTFDGDNTVTRDVVFDDDRFSSAYLDDDDRMLNAEFGFNKITQISNLPTYIADFITKQIYPLGTAVLRTIGSDTFIEIRTNTFASDQVQSSETSNNTNGAIELSTLDISMNVERQLGIWEGAPLTEINNERPHTAFRENTVAKTHVELSIRDFANEPEGYDFSPNDSLIAVINNDQANGTFVLRAGRTDIVSGGSPSTTEFRGDTLRTVFASSLDGTDNSYDRTIAGQTDAAPPFDSDLRDYFVSFSGKNGDDVVDRNSLTTSPDSDFTVKDSSGSDIDRAQSPVLSVVRTTDPRDANATLINASVYTIGNGLARTSPLLSDFQSEDFANSGLAVGDIVIFSSMDNSVNDGTFVIIALTTSGIPAITVINTSGADESGAGGIATIGQKRRITDYNFTTGTITVGDSFRDTPLEDDEFFVIVNTVPNIVSHLNNPRLSSLPSQAEIVGSDRGQRVQISSLMEGSAGYVEITGGFINNTLDFSTAANRGLQGYNYYVGLLSLVHRTIYGDDTDLITFPGVGAAGVNFQVLAPTVTEIILEIDITLQEGVSIAAVENEVNTAITGYINGLGVGEDVIVEEIRSRTIQINGIIDVVIIRLVGGAETDAIQNIAIADNEIARIKVSDITLG